MSWAIEYLEDAKKELRHLDGSIRKQILAGIRKVSQNPLAKSEGGYGKPLGNKGNRNLTGLLEVKFRRIGIRAIYLLVRKQGQMKIVVISARADDEVYALAEQRRKNL